MDHLQQLRSKTRNIVFAALVAENFILIGGYVIVSHGHASPLIVVIGSICIAIGLCAIIAVMLTNVIVAPLQALWQSILHLSPTEHGVVAPEIDRLPIGKELVTSLTAQIYQMTTVAETTVAATIEQTTDINRNFVAQSLPLPLITLDATETITFANDAAEKYIGIAAADMIGKNAYMVLDMSFPSPDTFDAWLKEVKIKNATATHTWERVRLNIRDDHPTRLFDLATYYNRDNQQRVETMLVLFDHTEAYSQDDQAVSFIALSVHELRTPLTLLRGYIEVLEDELSGAVNEELQGFILKMRSQADQLMAFVNNILNVARVDGDQLELKLSEAVWTDVLKKAIEGLSLRAKVRGITLHCRLATDLPTVGVDPISIQEVINNLVDNAIKYSANSKVIEINTHLTKDGLIETTIQDFGLGITNATLPNLFTKFYRDHRNRAQVGGTGLGLYLSKAIVTAHGGTIWASSKENEGSTFGFTLVPYAQLAEESKQNGDQEIVRGAHSWIKNHSLYRR